MEGLIIQLEIYQEERELQEAGLSKEEIEGYFEFFIDTWFPVGKDSNEHLCPRHRSDYMRSVSLRQTRS